ncbi:MAG: LysM peptidoglycan-binding domain-containing protein [Myxococcota bacterium]|nr:LysM peptidoglycan-binding domain-containing protein [Myxococcota bacterium]
MRARALLAASLVAAAVAGAAADDSYEVRPGDTLWKIARRTVGDPTLWPALYRANRDQIKDPALLYPGQKLAIPRIEPAEREAVRREAQAHGTQ